MKKNKVLILVVVCLLVITGVLAVVHQNTRTKTEEGSVLVEAGGKSVSVSYGEMDLVPVKGSISNNKGEVTEIDGQGIRLADVLALAGVDAADVTVTAADEYSAQVAADELAEENKAWLLIEEEGARLIVFGDTGSKRNVRNVTRITVE